MSTNISVKPEYPMVQNRIQRPGTKRMISDPYRAVQVQWQRFKSKYGRERAKYIRFCPCRIHALPSIYCFTFPILRPLFGIPHLRFLVQDSSFGIPRSGFPVPVPYSAFFCPAASCAASPCSVIPCSASLRSESFRSESFSSASSCSASSCFTRCPKVTG